MSETTIPTDEAAKTCAELADRVAHNLERLAPDEASTFADDIEQARASLLPVKVSMGLIFVLLMGLRLISHDKTMSMSKSERKILTITTAIMMLLVALMVVPFPMIVARNCTIRVVDSVGKPWPDAKISRGWAFGSSESLSEKQTGPGGVITFESLAEGHSLLGRCFLRW